jgi:hypothetical protein
VPRLAPTSAGWVVATAVALAVLAAPAAAAPSAHLHIELQPKRLGAPAAVSLGFHVGADTATGRSPLSGFSLRLPAGMGFAASELGLRTCPASALLAGGVRACPHESLIGAGVARVRVPFGSGAIDETARLSIFMTRPVEGRTAALFYFDGREPVIAPLVLHSEVLTPRGSRASVLRTSIPPIPTVAEGPEGELVALRATIGPRSLRYVRRVDGRPRPYRPRGVSIPARCPAGGFIFTAGFRFRDGGRTAARDTVPCPAGAREAASGRAKR